MTGFEFAGRTFEIQWDAVPAVGAVILIFIALITFFDWFVHRAGNQSQQESRQPHDKQR